MSSLSDALHALAAKCRYWSSNVLELGAAKDLRGISAELDQKARECKEIECPADDTGPPHDRSQV